MTTLAHKLSRTIESTFNFEVEKLPLTGPRGQETPFYTMFRTDTGEQVGGACKEGYTPHTVDDVRVMAEAALSVFDQNIEETKIQAWWSGDSHEIIIAPSDEYRESIANDKDAVWPRIHIKAGYSGSTYKASLGLWRDACSNLIIPRCMHGTTASIFHTTNLRPRIDELAETFRDLGSNWGEMVATFKAMSEKKVNFESFIVKVFGTGLNASGDLTGLAVKRTEQLVSRLMKDRAAMGSSATTTGFVSLWEALNVAQGYLQHDVTRRNYRTTLERSFAQIDDPRVNRVYETALALAN